MIEPTQCHLWTEEQSLTPHGLDHNFDLIERHYDSSHLMYALMSCKLCGQKYFYEYKDEVDYENGNDPYYLTYIPIGSDQ